MSAGLQRPGSLERSSTLRSFEQLCQETDEGWLIAAEEGHATQSNSGAYAQPWHWHDCVMFILPSRGALELRHEDRCEGSWLTHERFAVVPAHRAHETRAGMGANSHAALYVTGAMLNRLDRAYGSLREFQRRTRAVVLLQRTPAIRTLQQLATLPDDGGYGYSGRTRALAVALTVQCIAEATTGQVLPAVSKTEHGLALVEELKDYIRLHADQFISLDALGERFGVSRRHITRLFRDGTGLSVGEFRLRVRLKTACELLGGTDLPVGEVAFRVGFDSGAALGHAMRRVKGCSPSDVRRASMSRTGIAAPVLGRER
ncbi:transcriptional regulator, AraC family [Variovorax sp. YR750]|uniref:helix-turn-helix domain-containing protein n=1 Tax=Variovorax sp. YR750 TaxID=1884384 RepID=UPI0008D0BB04|nr:AraC family transcriptional regulator [Variovorax sp. YR750]SEL04838.1 transcriptional regulator, AraC family [Variovorax sp. YR750]